MLPPFHRPFDWEKSGDQRLFSDMVTPVGLAEIKTYADGIGPWKPYIVPVKGQLDADGNLKDINGDGKTDLMDASTQDPTSLIADAHKLGLFVHAFTFRNEKRHLAHSYEGDPHPSTCNSFVWASMAYSANSPTPRLLPADHNTPLFLLERMRVHE